MNHSVTTAATNRRRWLQTASLGFGVVGLAGLYQQLQAAELSPQQRLMQPHFVPRAKRVILLFMNGGPSQVDTWDYKPGLAQRDGQELEGFDKNTGFFTENVGPVMRSPFQFQRFDRGWRRQKCQSRRRFRQGQ